MLIQKVRTAIKYICVLRFHGILFLYHFNNRYCTITISIFIIELFYEQSVLFCLSKVKNQWEIILCHIVDTQEQMF